MMRITVKPAQGPGANLRQASEDPQKSEFRRRASRAPAGSSHALSIEGPAIPGVAEIVMGRDAAWRVYRAYWKTHPFVMALLGLPIRWRIKAHKQVLVRVRPDDPNPLAGITDPSNG